MTGVNPVMPNTNPSPIQTTVSQSVFAGSPTGEFQIEGISPRKMAKVHEMNRFGGLGSVCLIHEDNQLEYKGLDFLRSEKPDIVMIQETKKAECDRRFVGSVWTTRNKEWAVLPACGASGGILVIWDSKKLHSEEVVLGSFSVSVKFAVDGSEQFWLSAVYGPNSTTLRKDFGWSSRTFWTFFPCWCVGGDFNVIRRCSKNWVVVDLPQA
ncbi:hypothetical protein AAG906_021559 [Vitis piasezkii]